MQYSNDQRDDYERSVTGLSTSLFSRVVHTTRNPGVKIERDVEAVES